MNLAAKLITEVRNTYRSIRWAILVAQVFAGRRGGK